MSLRANGKRVKAIFYGYPNTTTSTHPSHGVTEVHANRVRVWPDKDILWLDLDSGSNCRKRLDRELSARGYSRETVTKIPFRVGFYRTNPSDSSPIGTVNLFEGMDKLTQEPTLLGAEHVTNATGMFSGCYSLTEFTQPLPNLTSAYSMFSSCKSLTRAVVGSTTPGKASLVDIQWCLAYTDKLQSTLVSVSPDVEYTYNAFFRSSVKDYQAGSGTNTTPIKYKTSGGKTIDVHGAVVRVAGSNTPNNKGLVDMANYTNSLTFEPYYRETSTGFVRIPY